MVIVSSPDHTLSQGETVWWTKSNFLGLHALLQQCHLAMYKTFHAKPAQKRYGYSSTDKNFYCCKGSLCNNYQSCNLIGPYHFWGISQRNSRGSTWLWIMWSGILFRYSTSSDVTMHSVLVHDYYSRLDPSAVFVIVDTSLKNGHLDIKAHVRLVVLVV